MGKGITLRLASLERLQRLLLEAMTGSAPVAIRADVGSALGRIGDPRFRPDCWWLPDEGLLGFIRVEAGPFTMGSDPGKDEYSSEDEQPQHVVNLPEFFVARYPVTVAQFQAFVESARFQVGDKKCLRDPPNHPVRWVSFHEALAYSRWLTSMLQQSESTPAPLRECLVNGWVMTLPSEAEWERAARGQDARIYPWAGGFNVSNANYREAGLGTTSAVGLFPGGVSACGAFDMSGNVWEWTRSLWRADWDNPPFRYPFKARDARREKLDASDDILRVLRGGGSFGDGADALRAANRDRRWPVNRAGNLGFRVTCSRPRT